MPVVPVSPSSGGSYGISAGEAVSGAPISGAPLATEGAYGDGSIGTAAAKVSPYPGVPNDVLALLTDAGRNLVGRMLTEGLAFKVIGFRVGRGGYNPAIPTEAAAIDPAATELDDPFFPVTTAPPEEIDRFEQPNDTGVAFLCRMASTEARAGLGEQGIYVEVTSSPNDPTEVGDIYLFAIVHRPLVAKTQNDVLVWRVVVQY